MPGPARNEAKTRANDVAAYVATMAGELKTMAERNELAVLAYLLDLARLEAEARAQDGAGEFADVRTGRANN